MSVFLETSLGELVIDLYVDQCPKACKNFLKLCQMKVYNNALFFDVQKEYLTEIKTLKPISIYEMLEGPEKHFFEDEIQPTLKHDILGVVSTSNLGPNKNNSNFFITLANRSMQHLDNKHTIFGQV